MIGKVLKGVSGLIRSVLLNAAMFSRRMASSKVVVFQMHAANQLPHTQTVLRELSRVDSASRIACYILVHPTELTDTRAALQEGSIDAVVSSYYASPFLLFWDVVVTLDQRMHLPLLNVAGGLRICMFHGQPTKGNVYSGFNYEQLDGLFLYGPLMRDYYLVQKELHPEWPALRTWEVGQPKTDALVTNRLAPADARKLLGLDSVVSTVIYAPSFESCASLAMYGEEIITALMSMGCNVIIKPHPSFYRNVNENDDYFDGVPHALEWAERARHFAKKGRVIFPLSEQSNTRLVLEAADVLITDHSGIAFDAVLLDKPLVFFDCPEFFGNYLPERFGIDGEEARNDTTCNAGRPAGTTVGRISELIVAVQRYLDQPKLHAAEREELRDSLLFNQGHATGMYVDTIMDLVGSKHV